MKPLYDALIKFKNSDTYPFFMPGHKMGNLLPPIPFGEIDVTEIKGTDNLFDPKDVILDAQQLAAKTFGAKKTYFLVNGSSSGLEAAIMASTKPNDKIIVARNCHISVYFGVMLSRLNPIYIYPKTIEPYGFAGGISPLEIETLFKNHNDIKAVIITSPTFEGIVSDIQKIADIVHKNNATLIVDEAHGSHFHFHDKLPHSAITQGADLVIQSTHKTLPALTGSSMLHVSKHFKFTEKLNQTVRLFQTTSPSYIKMAILDYVRDLLDTQGSALFDFYIKNIETAKEKIQSYKKIKPLNKSIIGQFDIFDIDIGKFTMLFDFDSKSINLNTYLDIHKICAESINPHHMIFMTSIADTQKGFTRLLAFLKDIENNTSSSQKENYSLTITPKKMLHKMEDVFNSNKIKIPLKDAKNKASGDFIIPYPPGIPIVVPGEMIDSDIINLVLQHQEKGLSVLGVHNGYVEVLDM